AVAVAVGDEGKHSVRVADGKAGGTYAQDISPEDICSELPFLAGHLSGSMTVDGDFVHIVAVGIRQDLDPVRIVIRKPDVGFRLYLFSDLIDSVGRDSAVVLGVK